MIKCVLLLLLTISKLEGVKITYKKLDFTPDQPVLISPLRVGDCFHFRATYKQVWRVVGESTMIENHTVYLVLGIPVGDFFFNFRH